MERKIRIANTSNQIYPQDELLHKHRYRAGKTEITNVSTIFDLDISSLRYINLNGTSIGNEGVLLKSADGNSCQAL